MTRLPISGDIVCYVASADYDPRDAASFSAAERSGREQAWAYLEAIRTIPGCQQAYLVSTGPEFGRRIAAHRGALSAHLGRRGERPQGRRRDRARRVGRRMARPQDVREHFRLSAGQGHQPIPLRCLASRDTANLFAAGRLADADQKAGASVRVMGTAFATEQAAGVAAAAFATTGSRTRRWCGASSSSKAH